MNVLQLVRALEGLDTLKGTPVDAVGHTYAADARDPKCTRCKIAVPARRQFTAVECVGRASTLDEYAEKREAATTKPDAKADVSTTVRREK